jgi:dTDP-glucose 4,6-dehydratase
MQSAILVTGAAGFVGRHVTKASAITSKRELVATDIMSDVDMPNYVQCDLRDVNAVKALFEQYEFDIIVHLAGQSVVGSNSDANVIMLRNLFEAAKLKAVSGDRCTRFILAGSAAEYGSLALDAALPVEMSPLCPIDPYAASKAECAKLAKKYQTTFLITLMRFANIYGPGQTDRIIPQLISAAAQGKRLTLNGQGRASRQYIYIADVCRAIRDIIGHRSLTGIFNIGGYESTARALVELIITAVHDHQLMHAQMPHPAVLDLSDNDPGAMRVAVDFSRATDVLGWQPRTSLYQGIKQTVAAQLGDKST